MNTVRQHHQFYTYVFLLLLVPCSLHIAVGGEQNTPTTADTNPPLVVNGLSATISTPLIMPRANAPFPLTITIKSLSQNLREGKLAVKVYDGNQKLCSWNSELLVMNNGERSNAVLLPPLNIDPHTNSIEFRVGWIEGDTQFALATRKLMLNQRHEHILTLALCLSQTALNPEKGILHNLAIERLTPAAVKNAHRRDSFDENDPTQPIVEFGLFTLPNRITLEDLPTTALGWCIYDAAAIAGDNLTKLKVRHVQALEQWLRAGGACCIVPDGPLAPVLSELLRRVAKENNSTYVDHDGIATDSIQHQHFHVGLGRLVVAPKIIGPQNNNFDQPIDQEWRMSSAFLWRVRHDHAAVLKKNHTWNALELAKIANPREFQYNNQSSQLIRPFDAPAFDLRAQLIDVLWPERVEVIPFSIILLIFLAFVVVVGPGDWFLLGWLRAHRYTWVLFPVAAIACTWFTVWMSRYYLGGNDQFQHLQIIDLSKNGEILRRNHFELLFTGSSKTIVSDKQNVVWTSLGNQSIDTYDQYGYQRRYSSNQTMTVDNSAGGIPRYSGNFPAHYEVEQSVTQWTPALQRELSFTPIQLPWTLPTAGINHPDDVVAATSTWRSTLGPQSAVFLITNGNNIATYGNTNIFKRRYKKNDYYNTEANSNNSLLKAMCSHPTNGWFALASVKSPIGGASFDDLAVNDPSDPHQFLVVFVERRDDTLWVVRCLYRTPSQQSSQQTAQPDSL